ncbi:MAG: ABC transporter substrate-binding protein [Pseudobutyrivibrio sp.]|nr:ABC transporter substrate-binding protein [Pseudobutyrivibrio sp.]
MKKRLISLLAAATMTAVMFAGCGATSDSSEAGSDAGSADDTATVAAEDEGSVLNIYCWNDEFRDRVVAHMPGYEATGDYEGKLGDVTVKFLVTPNQDNAYQNNLDENLLKQDSASADDKIDIFLVEADYALKYVDAEYTMPIADLGIADSELANQYQYTKDVMTDSKGVLKGLSWQGCPGVLIYNRAIASEVLGTDDPAEVQNAVKDWDTFKDTAAKMKAAGYKMTSTTNDAYRVFSNNVSGKWVQGNKVVIDPNIKKWVDMSKEMADAGECGTQDLWSSEWSAGFKAPGDTFCYFGPAWLINFSMGNGPDKDDDGSIAHAGGWAAANGPQGFFWGGTWICAAAGTDNAGTIAEIMRALTTNEEVMTEIVKQDSDFVNNKPAMEAAAKDDSFAFAILGGQNPLQMFCDGAGKIDLSNQSAYDQGCNEEFQKAMKNYFDGNATYEEALEQFNKAIVEKYPGLETE